jgi:hypothetical protein
LLKNGDADALLNGAENDQGYKREHRYQVQQKKLQKKN